VFKIECARAQALQPEQHVTCSSFAERSPPTYLVHKADAHAGADHLEGAAIHQDLRREENFVSNGHVGATSFLLSAQISAS